MTTTRRSWFRFSLFAVAVFATLCCGYLGYYRGYQQGYSVGELDGKRYHFVTVPYEVGDLVTTTPNLVAPMQLHELSKYIQLEIEPDSWEKFGGSVTDIRELPKNQTLVITHTQPTHEAIARLLRKLRE